MSVKAHGALVDVTATSVEIHHSVLSLSLGKPATTSVPLADINGVSVREPTATAQGWVALEGTDVTIPVDPHQDAEAIRALIAAAQSGEHDPGVPGLDFTAVDVETANWHWGSICQLGAVRFRDGRETESRTWLCQPPATWPDFDDVNISIHGITAADVADAAPFATVAAELVDFVGGDVFVAHNAQFDSSAQHAALQATSSEVPDWQLACSLALARYCSARGVLDVANHKLPTVAAACGMESFSHHDACADARAAGVIVAGLAQKLGLTGGIAGLFDECGFRLGALSAEQVMPVLQDNVAPTSAADLGAGTDFRSQTRESGARRPAPWKTVATPETIPEPNDDADPQGPLYGQHVTLTGDFEPFDKGQLWSAIAERGGVIGKNVTKKTTLLVVGTWAKKTSKEKRAEELRDKGQEITFWSANELLDAVGLSEEPPF